MDGIIISSHIIGEASEIRYWKRKQIPKSKPRYRIFLYTDAWDTFTTKPAHITEKELDFIRSNRHTIECRADITHTRRKLSYTHKLIHLSNINGGMVPAKSFWELVEANPLTRETVDQVWFTDFYLKYHETGIVKLDTDCRIFQTIAFCPEDNFIITKNERKIIRVTGTLPSFIHGNGHNFFNTI